MIFQVKTGEKDFEVDDFVAFVTGENSVNTRPNFLRIDEVTRLFISNTNTVDEVKELSTGKLWYPYSVDVIKIGKGIRIKGVNPIFELTDKI